MTRVNKTNRVGRFRKAACKKFMKSIDGNCSVNDFIEKLGAVMTPSEILMLEKRLIASLLTEKGVECREIGRLIDVSHNTVMFVKHHFVRNRRPRKITPQKRIVHIHHSSKGMGAALWK